MVDISIEVVGDEMIIGIVVHEGSGTFSEGLAGVCEGI